MQRNGWKHERLKCCHSCCVPLYAIEKRSLFAFVVYDALQDPCIFLRWRKRTKSLKRAKSTSRPTSFHAAWSLFDSCRTLQELLDRGTISLDEARRLRTRAKMHQQEAHFCHLNRIRSSFWQTFCCQDRSVPHCTVAQEQNDQPKISSAAWARGQDTHDSCESVPRLSQPKPRF